MTELALRREQGGTRTPQMDAVSRLRPFGPTPWVSLIDPKQKYAPPAKQPFEFAQVSNRLRADSERVHVTTVDA